MLLHHTRLAAIAGLIAATLIVAPAAAQTFTKITTPGNPIVALGGGASGYGGASWIDADGDGDVELFVNKVGIFRNDGGGTFVHVPGPLTMPGNDVSFGNSWADVDNDGDLDVYVSGGAPDGSSLFLNQGGLVFEKVTTGAIGASSSNAAWGCAFGDYDGDGLVDVVAAAAYQFAGILNPNRLFHNDGGGAFTQIEGTPITQDLAPFTIPTWSDYDLDGDPDLFIGTGPANGTVALDYLFENQRESMPGLFERITSAPLGTDQQDGQVYNWIDYDNDGDLDVYLTNYTGTGGIPNRLYRNVGGTFVAQTLGAAGPIATDAQISLASVWQDFDNDGDLDCVVTHDGAASNRYYRNNGNGTFATLSIANLTSTAGPHWCATSGDYDDDGRMDLFVTGTPATFALLRNTTVNSNHWLKVRLEGTASNRAAIGARVRVLAMIDGNPVWQMRELSAQNSFNGMNALEAHFGLGAAMEAESLVVEWPSGIRMAQAGVPADTHREVVEAPATAVGESLPAASGFGIRRVTPNPGRAPFDVRFTLATGEPATLELMDVGGRRVETASIASPSSGSHTLRLVAPRRLARGVYFVRLSQGARRDGQRVVVLE